MVWLGFGSWFPWCQQYGWTFLQNVGESNDGGCCFQYHANPLTHDSNEEALDVTVTIDGACDSQKLSWLSDAAANEAHGIGNERGDLDEELDAEEDDDEDDDEEDDDSDDEDDGWEEVGDEDEEEDDDDDDWDEDFDDDDEEDEDDSEDEPE